MKDEGGGASRSTEPASGTSAATDVSLREHLAQRLHDAEHRIDERDRYIRDADMRFMEERDRRYMEVNIEREKALKIKETADLAALGLAREIQTYKDEKANQLREQINSERGLYATKGDIAAAVEKMEATIKPLANFVTTQQGRSQGIGLSVNAVVVAATIVLAALGLWLGTQ